MRLGNGQDACYSLGIEPVERLAHHMGAYGFGSFHHCIADMVHVIKECGVALPQLQQKMNA